MFGFFQNKQKETGPTEIACPLCDHRQLESRLAVSSYCRHCGAYLTFEKSGEVKARPQTPPDPFANRPPQPEVEIDYSPREDKEPILPASLRVRRTVEDSFPDEDTPGEGSASPVSPAIKTQPEPSQEPSEPEAPVVRQETVTGVSRYQGVPTAKGNEAAHRKIETREVTCFECGATHAANILTNSTQCRSCGRLISMADREIRDTCSSPIQTRGNVHIHKKGLVRAAPIQCHDLIVEGDFTHDAECSGDLIIRRHGRIPGKIRCRRLLVEKRAKVEFLGPVEMEEGKIDGIVTGNLACHGLLTLEKKSILTGNLKVGRLSIAEGAKHNGQVRTGPF